MKEYYNISALRNATLYPIFDPVPVESDIAYVKGHSNAGDGGGGIFIWRTTNPVLTTPTPGNPYYKDNDGTIVWIGDPSLANPANNTGRWVRQYDGYINVAYFGATGNTVDYTTRIQAAIDFASNNGFYPNAPTRGTAIYIPSGDYLVTNLVLKNGISIIGDSIDRTIIYSPNGTGYLFEMEDGPVLLSILNLHIIGQNTVKGCFHFKGVGTGSLDHGGLWLSTFKNINIREFQGHGIYLEGTSSDIEQYNLPNQSVIFENVHVVKVINENNGLKMTGQNGQMTFINSSFDGFYNPETMSYCKGVNVAISNVNNKIAGVISFINSTFQDTDYGVAIDFAENITFDNCWFENLGVAITVRGLPTSTDHTTISKSINILNNRFVNAAGYGNDARGHNGNLTNGDCIQVTNSQVNILNNFISPVRPASGCKFIQVNGGDNYGGINVSGNSFGNQETNYCNGILQVRDIVTNISLFGSGNYGLICQNNKILLVNTSTKQIKFISSFLCAGETLLIRANSGAITFNASGNIFLSNRTTLTLANGEAALFTKFDYGNNPLRDSYQLTSIVKTTAP